MMSLPLHDHPCYCLVLCPFGLPAGMHAEAAWNALSVADLSVAGLFPRPRVAWDHSCRGMFDAWSLPYIARLITDLRFDPLPISAHKNIAVAPAAGLIQRTGTPLLRRTHYSVTPYFSHKPFTTNFIHHSDACDVLLCSVYHLPTDAMSEFVILLGESSGVLK
jgi:hypothetical protein